MKEQIFELDFSEEDKQIEEMTKCLCNSSTRSFLECLGFAQILYKADYRKQRKAEWKSGKTCNGEWGYSCSACSAAFTGENAEWIAKEHDYCPKCGAKMKGGAE